MDRVLGGLLEATPPEGSGLFRWCFHDGDTTRCADRLFRHLDRVFELLRDTGHVFLTTIELEAESGLFPELLVACLGDEAWDYDRRFFVAPILKTDRDLSYQVGRLTFEADAGQTRRVLRLDDGIRWGAALQVGGAQVPETAVAEALTTCVFDLESAASLERIARFAWIANSDLDELHAWVRPDDHASRAALAALERETGGSGGGS